MKRVILLILCACLLIGCQSTVQNLNVNKNASKTFKAYFFYKPGCHACEKVEPIVKNASKKYDIIFCNVENMSVSCINVSKKIGLHAVPTMAIVDKEYKVYVGSDRISEFLKNYEKSS